MAGKANPRFEQALAFAAQAHAAVHQERKGTDFPYVAHPIRVAEILDRFECSEDVIVAGFLHDTIEDTDVTADEISATFGPRVAALVTSVSEPDKSLPWKTRKQHTIEHLEQEQDPDVLALVAADKLDNVRSITDTLRHLGQEKTWALFNADRSEQHWYYRRIAEILLRQGPGQPTVPDARLRDSDALPRSRTLDDLLRREALPHPSRRTGVPRRPDQALASRPLCARAGHDLDRRPRLSAECRARPRVLRHLGGVPARRGLVRAGGRSRYERTAEPDRPARAGPAVRRRLRRHRRGGKGPRAVRARSSRSGTTAPESRRASRASASSSGSTPAESATSTTSCSTAPCPRSARRAATAPAKR